MKKTVLLLIALLTMLVVQVNGQWSVTAVDTDFTIDFDNTVAGVNEGVFAGGGFAIAPAAGQLDADAWAIQGMSDLAGLKDFGVEITTAGDYARGISAGGVTTGGLYAFEVEAGNYAMGVQPSGADFTPGYIAFKVTNNTGVTVNYDSFSYDVWVRNDGAYSSSFNGEFSLDGITWSPAPEFVFATTETPDGVPAWVKTTLSYEGPLGFDLLDGQTIFFRIYSNDISGATARDEMAVDNITINLSYKTIISIFPFIETFEASSTTLVSWTQIQEQGTKSWTFATGAGGGTILTAHEGTVNARFVGASYDGDLTKLVTPILDLSSVAVPELNFWYGQSDWGGDQNELKIYYRTGLAEPWIELAYYFTSIATWTEVTLPLPDKSSMYQIAFEGMDNWGYANVVDLVTVREQPINTVDWANLQWPDVTSVQTSTPFSTYARVYATGITEPAGQGAGIECWIGYSTNNTDPSTWTDWVAATYNVDDGNNDEYMASLSFPTSGTYYYASRFRLSGGPFSYGGYNVGGGNFWDGTTYVSGVATVTAAAGTECASPLNYGLINDPSTTNILAADGNWWYEFTLGTDHANVMVSLCGSDFDTRLAVYDDCADFAGGTGSVIGANPAGSIAYDDDACAGGEFGTGDTYASTYTFPTLAAGTYRLVIYGYSAGDAGNIRLEITGSDCETPSAVNATNMTTTAADIAWTASVLSETSWNLKVSTTSIDPTTAPGDVFDGIVNTTPLQAIAGLAEATNYYVYVQSACGSTWTAEYMFTTLAGCPAPITLTSTAFADNANLAWDQLTGTAWNLKVSTVVIDPITGTGNIYDAAAGTNPFNVTGLNPQTTYYWYVQTDCGAGITSDWSVQGMFTTPCASISVFPWTENFQTITTPNLPSCWSQNNVNADTDFWKTWTTYGVSGSNAAGLYTDFNAGANNDYLILPAFDLTGNEQLRFFVRARSTTEPNDYRVVLSTTGTLATDFTEILAPLTTVSSTTMTEVGPISLAAYTGNAYIAIHVPAGGLDGYYIYFDNFTVEEIPSCPIPNAIFANNITPTTANLNWTENGAATAWNIVAATAPFDPTVSTGDFGLIPVTGNPFTTPAVLAPNTTYYWYVQADCGGGDLSAWSAQGVFTTSCIVASVPFFEGFETGFTNATTIGGCWSQQTIAGGGTWMANSTNTTYNRTPRTGSFNSTLVYGNTDWLYYPVNLVAGTAYKFEMYARQDGATPANASITVSYGNANNAAAMINPIIPLSSIINGGYQLKSGTFTPATSGTYYIGILGTITSTPWYISIDDITLREVSSENDILSFSFVEQTGPAVITSFSHNITIEVGSAVNLNGLVPTITASPNATLNPLSGVAQDFTAAFLYTVTAEDLTPQVWTVNVTNALSLSNANDITAFSFTEQTGPATIDDVNHTVDIEIAWTANLTNLIPTISVSPLAVINPAGGVAQDFSAAFNYTVTAEDLTDQIWTINVTQQPIPAGLSCAAPINYGLINDPSTTNVLAAGANWWYMFTLDQAYANVLVNTCGSDFDDRIAIYDDCADFAGGTGNLIGANPVGSIGYDDDDCAGGEFGTGDGYAATHSFATLAAGTYYVVIYGYSAGDAGNIRLEITGDSDACLVPTALVASGITTSEATLNWTAGFNETAWNLIYGATGFDPLTTGTLVPNVTYPYVLLGLTEDTGYDVYVQSICSGPSTSAWSTVENFTTLAACPDQTGVVATVTGADVSIAWNAFTATGWNLKVSTTSIDPTTGTGDVFDGPIATNPYALTSLPINQTYYVYVQADCLGVWSPEVSFWIGYCVPASASVDGTGITNVTFGNAPNIVNNTTAAETNNYGNYSAMIGDLQQTTASNVAITFNTDTYDYNTKIWIDFNDDMDFDDASEDVYTGLSSSTSPNTLNASVTIPLTAPLGNHRMRIGGGDMVVPTPCATGATWTCYEDYTVNVTAAPSCLAPSALFVNNITSTTADLNWTENGSAVLWNLKASTTPIDPITEPGDFPPTNTPNNPFNITGGLTPNTTYYWYVQADCGGDVSAWVSGTFTTACGALTTFPYFEGFEGATFAPNCWTNDTWVQSLYGAAHTGTEWAYTNLAGSTLTSPEFTLPATGNYVLSYWYRVESATYPQDAQISLSTDGINFTTPLQSFVGYTNVNYLQFTYDLAAYANQSIWIQFEGQYGTGGFDYGFLVDDVEIREISDENDILTFSFVEQTGAAVIDAVNHTVAIEVAMGTNPNGIIPTFTISPFATVDFASGIAQDFTGPFVYTVTSESSIAQAWTVNVTVAAALSDQNDILTFSFPEQTGPAVIDALLHEVNIEVAWNANTAALIPTYTISPLATSNPASGVVQDFSTPFTYVVTAQDLTPQNWVIKVAVGPTPVGANCANPIIVDQTALPYNEVGGTNCGLGDDYNTSACLGSYDGGEDIIYRLDLAVGGEVEITMSTAVTWTGIAILDACPDTGACLDFSTLAGSGTQTLNVVLAAGSYYIMIDTWPAPDCISAYNLTIEMVYPTIAGIDINSDVVDINVCQGTTEATAIAGLVTDITISDSDATTYLVPLTWTVASYDGNIPADYTATGTFTLPAGVDQTTPVATPLEVSATITVDPFIVPSFSFENVYCLGDVADLLPAASDNGITGTWDIATISTAAVGSVDYTFTADAGQCAVATTVVSVTVNDIVTPTFTFETTYCIGAIADLLPASSVEGITGTWDIATISTAAVGSTDYTFTPDAGQCAIAAVVAVTVNGIITPTFTFGTTYCVGAVADLLPASSDNGVTGTWMPATISTAAAGTSDYDFTVDAGQCAIDATIPVTINDLPVVTCPVDFEVTSTAIVTLAGGLPAGGVYSGTGVVAGDFDPSTLPNADYTITYTYNDGMCDNFCDFVITVNVGYPELDVIDLNADVVDINVCQGTLEADAIAALATEITITNVIAEEFIVPLTWTIASYDENTPADYNATGTFTLPIGVSQTSPVTVLEVTAVITVDPTIIPVFSFETNYCLGDVADALPATSDNGVAGTWDIVSISTAAVGSVDYTFTPDAGVCSVPIVVSVTVNPIVTPTFTFETSYCLGAIADLLPASSVEGITGTWDIATISTAAVGSTDYTFTPDAGQCAIAAVVAVSVNDIVTPTFSFMADYCLGEVADLLPATSDNGITGTWDIATISTATAGSVDYTFTPDAGQCAISSMISVTVNDIITPTFSFVTEYCLGDVADLLPASSDNGITGTWDIVAISTAAAGSVDYTFTPDAGVCSAPVVVSVIVNPIVTPTFTFATTYCIGATADVLPASSVEGITGTWDIVTISTAALGSTDYTFTPDAGQCAIAAVVAVSVNDELIPTFSFAVEYCFGETADALPLVSDNTITGTWLPAVINTTTSGDTDYTFTVDAGQCAAGVIVSVTVNDLPVVTCPADMLVAVDAPVAFTGQTPVGGVFSGTGVVGNTFDPNALADGDYTVTYTYTDATTGCSNFCEFIVTVDLVNGIITPEAAAISVYPNPNNGQFNLSFFNVNGEVNYQIFDTKGSVIVDENIMTSGNTVKEVSLNLVPGVYYVKLITETQTVVEKLVIE